MIALINTTMPPTSATDDALVTIPDGLLGEVAVYGLYQPVTGDVWCISLNFQRITAFLSLPLSRSGREGT